MNGVTVGWIYDMNKRIGYGKAPVLLEEFTQHYWTTVIPECYLAVSCDKKGVVCENECVFACFGFVEKGRKKGGIIALPLHFSHAELKRVVLKEMVCFTGNAVIIHGDIAQDVAQPLTLFLGFLVLHQGIHDELNAARRNGISEEEILLQRLQDYNSEPVLHTNVLDNKLHHGLQQDLWLKNELK